MDSPVNPARFAAYLGVTVLMVLTPGPAVLFAIATGARRGRAAVMAAVLGMNLANLVWWSAAALGLIALAGAFPLVFRALAIVGALYVAWLGLRAIHEAWRGGGEPAGTGGAPRAGQGSLREGFLVQIANPKALLFVTAILPPFVDPDRPVLPQIAVLATSGVAMDVVAMAGYGLGGAALAARMTEPRFRRGFQLFTGLLLLGAALLIALRA